MPLPDLFAYGRSNNTRDWLVIFNWLVGIARPKQFGTASLSSITMVGLVILSGCGRGSSGNSEDEQPKQDPTELQVLKPGTYGQTLTLNDESAISFTISIPESYDKETPIPLVVVLHVGARQVPIFFGRRILQGLIFPAFYDFDAIYVAPDSVNNTWTSGQIEKDLIALLNRIFEKYNIDRSKVALIGFSLGGTGTWHLASRHQDLFTAAIPIACRPTESAIQAHWETPLYVIHSDSDEVITVNRARDAVTRVREAGANIEYVEIKGASHYETGKYVLPIRDAASWLKKVWNTP